MKFVKRILAIITTIVVLLSLTIIAFAKIIKNSYPPTSPIGFTSKTVSTSEIDLSWSAVSGASGYKVFKANLNNSNYIQIATITGTIYKNIGLKPSTIYRYFVRSYNSYGASIDSRHVSSKTLQTPILKSPKLFLGYATYYSYDSIVNNRSSIDEIATATYVTDGLGKISGIAPKIQIDYANNNNIKPLAMITNDFDGNIAKSLLESSTNRQTLITNTLNAIKSNNYKGVNVDLEGIYYYDRSYYTTFIKELNNALHPLGYEVTISIPAKTVDSVTNPWEGAYDYAALSNYCDRIVIMTYDEHYPGGQAGPVASIGWVQNVAKYAITAIPKEKIVLGLSAYGYDWSSNGTKAYGIDSINNIALKYGAVVQLDATSKCPYFNYIDSNNISHSVWFENNKSVEYKLDIVNNMNLSGVAMWRLGLENSDYWTSIKTKLGK